MFKNKKAEGMTAILIIVIIALFLGWLINFNHRECNSNKECGSESYCGSDFSCHQYPTIQKTVVQYNLLWPAVIIGISMMIAAFIFRREKTFPERAVEHNVERIVEEPAEAEEPYYNKDNESYYKSTETKTP